jgi:hypothetical protein
VVFTTKPTQPGGASMAWSTAGTGSRANLHNTSGPETRRSVPQSHRSRSLSGCGARSQVECCAAQTCRHIAHVFPATYRTAKSGGCWMNDILSRARLRRNPSTFYARDSTGQGPNRPCISYGIEGHTVHGSYDSRARHIQIAGSNRRRGKKGTDRRPYHRRPCRRG